MDQQKLKMEPLDWLLLFALSLCWGGSFFTIEFIVDEIPTFTIVFVRLALTAISLFILLPIMGLKLPSDKSLWMKLMLVGFFALTLPFSLIIWAQLHVDSSLVGILTTIIPLLTALLVHFVSKEEKLTPPMIVGLLVGIAGAALIIGPGALSGFNVASIAQFALIGAFCCFALANVTFRSFRSIHPIPMITVVMTGSALWSLPLAWLERDQWTAPSQTAIWAMIALILVGTTLAYVIYNRVIVRAGATNASQVTFLIPITSLVLGMLILGERPHWTAFVGMGIIFLGLLIKDGRISLGSRKA